MSGDQSSSLDNHSSAERSRPWNNKPVNESDSPSTTYSTTNTTCDEPPSSSAGRNEQQLGSSGTSMESMNSGQNQGPGDPGFGNVQTD